ncbi:MAG: TetR/AcrR family transcriptional regulator [Anaerolineales bacterium]|nr:TetR/AcrR family transcriptional regulator [Anaerolineales bacterium]
MSITTRRGQHKEELRRLILDTAERLFVDAGSYDAVSMRKIAREIDYSATTIYLYFKDKDDLFQTLLRETFRQLSRTVALAVTQRDPMMGFYQAMKACVAFGLEHPQHYRLLFMVRPTLRADGEASGRIGEEAFNLLRHQAGLCVSAQVMEETDPDLLAQGAWAVVHGLTSMLLSQVGTEQWQSRLTEHVIKNYLAGLWTPNPSTTWL